jgi:hypothetical protein
MKLQISGKSITRAAIKEFAPDLVSSTIGGWVKGKTVKEFYNFLETGDLWDKLPPGRQEWLLSHRPWDLHWLTLYWIIGAIGKANRSLGYLIANSPELQSKLQENISQIKGILE